MHQIFASAAWALTLAVIVLLETHSVRADGPDNAVASDELGQLTAALDDLDQWVGTGQNGDKWRDYLRSESLRAEMAKGDAADPSVVARVLQQYESEADGLKKRRFVAVRRDLQAWLNALREQYADNLPKLVWAARGDHQPVSDEKIAEARSNLRNAARRLERRIGGDSSFAQGWKKYLRWPLLQPHLSDDVKIDGQSLRNLDAVIRRFRKNTPGLEHPVFVTTAEALQRYRELVFWHALGQRRDTRPRYSQFLLELEKQLTRNMERPTVESTRQIGKALGIMHQLGDTPQLVQQIRSRFQRPNVLAEFSSTALSQLATRPVAESTPVRDCILGAQVRGTAASQGVLSMSTLPAEDHVAIELRLAGNIRSRTNSYKKPVRVSSLGSTNFVATKHLQISDEQFFMMPSAAAACTKAQTCSVKKTGGKLFSGLIERIARKKVAENKSQAEYIGARHAEQRIENKFDRQVSEAIFRARHNYDTKFHAPLDRLGMFPENLHMASSSTHVPIKATLANYQQISTALPPPGTRTDNDLTLQVHETAPNNLLPFMLAGMKLRQDKETEPPRIEGDAPPWLKKLGDDPKVKEQFVASENTPELATAEGERLEKTGGSNFKPWSFLLNSEHPVSVSFDDQKLTLRIRIAELKTIEDGEESIRRNWDFLVTYNVTQQDNRVMLYRDEDIQALPTGFDPDWFGDPRWDDKLTGKQVSIRKILEENLNRRAADGGGFPLEIALPPIELPRPGGMKQTLQLQQLDCDNGWLTLGYRLP